MIRVVGSFKKEIRKKYWDMEGCIENSCWKMPKMREKYQT